jgi:RND family efflux transporter MFP subunit
MSLQTLGHRLAARAATVLATGGLGISVILWTGCQGQSPTAPQPPAVRVTVAAPIEQTTLDCDEFTGRTEAVESVEIRARVTGYLDKICFKDGADVKQGDLLFEIDSRPFQAAYDQAAAQVKVRAADLKFRAAEAERAAQLIGKNAVSKSDYDQIMAQQAQAQAALAAGEATERAAKLDVDFTSLRSPITGVTSRTRITRGNLVQADQTVLTTVVSVDPMYVYFDIDEHTILELQEAVRKGKIKVKENEAIPVWMELGDEQGFRYQGTIDFAENRVDANTGTIRVRGIFPNAKTPSGVRSLAPGLFARVRLPLGEQQKTLAVAERAIGTDQGQKYVLVVNAKSEVDYRPVTLGKLEGRLRIIKEGVKPGDRVIVNGMQRVRPGTTVTARTVDMASFAKPSEAETASADVAPPKATLRETPHQ